MTVHMCSCGSLETHVTGLYTVISGVSRVDFEAPHAGSFLYILPFWLWTIHVCPRHLTFICMHARTHARTHNIYSLTLLVMKLSLLLDTPLPVDGLVNYL